MMCDTEEEYIIARVLRGGSKTWLRTNVLANTCAIISVRTTAKHLEITIYGSFLFEDLFLSRSIGSNSSDDRTTPKPWFEF